MSRLPKYADDFIPTVEKNRVVPILMNIVAGATCVIAVFAVLRFFGVI